MKGDFSRSTFDPAKGYSSVRMQQGRVQLDADWNEQIDIQNHRQRRAVTDAIGHSGVPQSEPDSFRVRFENGQLVVDPGRMWVDGLLCEAQGNVAMDPPPSTDTHLAYLEVWERHVTAIEDPSIRETALGGPDTATRAQIVGRVRFAQLDDAATCPDPIGWSDPSQSDSQLTASFQASDASASDPCATSGDTGIAGLENRLYRVEIHDSGEIGQGAPTCKWSRDNGAVAAELLAVDNQQATQRLTVAAQGIDEVRGFADVPFFVEVSDDRHDLAGEPGVLAQVAGYRENASGEIELQLAEGSPAIPAPDSQFHPKVRRWEAAQLAVQTGDPIELENGVQIRFGGTGFRSGDYWLIAARALVGDSGGGIEWPAGEFRPPHGVERRIVRLGIVRFGETSVEDCRQKFAPLVDQISLSFAGGDGQAGMAGRPLSCPLEAAVTRGRFGVAGARVRFQVIPQGGGRVQIGANLATDLVAVADNNGIARVNWEMPNDPTPFVGQGEDNLCLAVSATLLDSADQPLAPSLTFSANLSDAREVAYDPGCSFLAGANTVQEALDRLCERDGSGDNIRIVQVRSGGRTQIHDQPILTEHLNNGIEIVFDRPVDPRVLGLIPSQMPVPTRPIVFVNLYLPFPLEESEFWGTSPRNEEIFGFQPVLLRGELEQNAEVLRWRPHPMTRDWLDSLMATQLSEITNHFLVELTIRGNFIWEDGVDGPPDFHLDGETFGFTAGGDDPTSSLSLPSGDGRRGGDFRTWSWLYSPEIISLQITEDDFSPPNARVRGTVRDPYTGRRLIGHLVQLFDDGDGLVHQLPTDGAGRFEFFNVKNGSSVVMKDIGGPLGFDVNELILFDFFDGDPGPDPKIAVDAISGIGPKLKARLEAGEINTADELAATEPERLAEILEVSSTRAETFIASARQLLAEEATEVTRDDDTAAS